MSGPNGQLQRWLVAVVVFASVGVTLLILASALENNRSATPAGRQQVFDNPIELDDFTLIERSGETVSLSDLRGRVLVIDFIFSHCAGPCPLMSDEMMKLQDRLAEHGERVTLVSVTVDPMRDTPAVLRAYADARGADPQRWLFLTGKRERIWPLIKQSFKLPVEDDPTNPAMPILHSQKFVLVDQQGRARGYYDALASTLPDGTPIPHERDELVRDIEHLLRQDAPATTHRQTLPRINAALNAISFFLLLLGYMMIRQRRITAHKRVMISAFIVSGVFLVLYVTDKALKRGVHTPFGGEGILKLAYYAMLISHVILAAAVPVFAILLIRWGLTNQIAKHKRLARVALPIWLYVSITGVAIYVLLYVVNPA